MVRTSIAIILARGGSKRIPKKNSVPINGRPMIAWTIQAALDSGSFSRILVSTDSEEIAAISTSCGVEVPFFRDAATDDYSSSTQATLVALSQAESYWGESYQFVSQLMANCPMRSSAHISSSFQSFIDNGAPAQISCFKFGWMNPWWAARLDANSRPEWLFPEAIQSRSQDLPQLYCPSGAIWIANKTALERYRSFYMPGHAFHELDWISAMDVDDPSDLLMANVCMKLRESEAIMPEDVL